jgi:hypothetical protein
MENTVNLFITYATPIGTFVALISVIVMALFWITDRRKEEKFDLNIKKFLIKELKTNLKIANELINMIERYKKENTPIIEFRYLEEKVFFSIINSHRVVNVLSDKSIDKLSEFYNTVATFNMMLSRISADGNFNKLAIVNDGRGEIIPRLLKEAINFLNELIPELEKE